MSAAQPSKLAGQSKVLEAYNASGAIVGCGYMMTALKGVDMIKKMIQDKGLTVMGTAARVRPPLSSSFRRLRRSFD